MDDLNSEPWMALQRLSCFTPSEQLQLLAHFGSPEAIFAAADQQLAMLNEQQSAEIKTWRDNPQHPLRVQIQAELAVMAELHIQPISLHCPRYPQALKAIHRPPLLLFVRGNVEALALPQLAVVGARKSSKLAMDIAQQWSAELALQGLVITSGLAVGVDGAAHRGALQAGGKTIAVLAHGLDHLYPQQHRELATDIIDKNGALVSEFPLGVLPKKDHFPRRNRIISGLCSGVLVVEAAIKSGSLITARYALEQNRDVFAVPGSINNVMAKGCHALIKDGAYLVESAHDIVSAMAWQPMQQASLFTQAVDLPELSQQAKTVLAAIAFEPTHIDELILSTGLPIATLAGELLMLEVDGWIESQGGNYRRVR